MTDLSLEAPSHYLTDGSITPVDIWAGRNCLVCDVVAEVWSGETSAELRETFTDVLAAEDDTGWAASDEQYLP